MEPRRASMDKYAVWLVDLVCPLLCGFADKWLGTKTNQE